MDTMMQIWQYAFARFSMERDDRGEVSATTVIWAAALVVVALGVSALLVSKIQAKADSINF